MTAVLRRPGSKLFRIIARATDPAATGAQIYAKTVSAVAQLFGRSSGGIVHQLSGPGAILPIGYIDGSGIAWVSASQVSIAAGRCRSDDDTFDIVLAGLVTADIANVGVVNGLDAGAEAADTWYAVWVIADSTGVAPAGSLLSASFSAPTLPAGYDKKRRVGAVRNFGTDFGRFFQRWATGRTRRSSWDRSVISVLVNGSAIAFTAVDCSSYIPPSSRNALFACRHAPGAGGAVTDALSVRPAGASSTDGPFAHRRGHTLNTTQTRLTMEMPTSATQQIEYMTTQAVNTVTLQVLAYDDEL